jgi:hypothetical protein
MAENIDGTPSGSGPYNTKIPLLGDNANIQKALRIYHYGTETPPLPGSVVSNGSLVSNSIAGYLDAITNRVISVEVLGTGSKYVSSAPSSIPDGYIWVDESSSAPTFNTDGTLPLSVARYQTTTPSGTIPNGALWVDKGSDPLTMYIYDSALSIWREIGGDLS